MPACLRSSLFLVSVVMLIPSCRDFIAMQHITSESGVIATLATNSFEGGSEDSTLICLSSYRQEYCSRRNAVFHSYRPLQFNAFWRGDRLHIIQKGGEIWKHKDSVVVENENGPTKVLITVDYRP